MSYNNLPYSDSSKENYVFSSPSKLLYPRLNLPKPIPFYDLTNKVITEGINIDSNQNYFNTSQDKRKSHLDRINSNISQNAFPSQQIQQSTSTKPISPLPNPLQQANEPEGAKKVLEFSKDCLLNNQYTNLEQQQQGKCQGVSQFSCDKCELKYTIQFDICSHEAQILTKALKKISDDAQKSDNNNKMTDSNVIPNLVSLLENRILDKMQEEVDLNNQLIESHELSESQDLTDESDQIQNSIIETPNKIEKIDDKLPNPLMENPNLLINSLNLPLNQPEYSEKEEKKPMEEEANLPTKSPSQNQAQNNASSFIPQVPFNFAKETPHLLSPNGKKQEKSPLKSLEIEIEQSNKEPENTKIEKKEEGKLNCKRKGHYSKIKVCAYKNCNFSAGSKAEIQKHVEQEHYAFECFFCQEKFNSEKSLQKHIDMTHNNSLPDFACTYSDKCSYVTKCQMKLEQHIQEVHKSIYCPVKGCSYVGDTRKYLLQHLKQKHRGNSSQFRKQIKMGCKKLNIEEGVILKKVIKYFDKNCCDSGFYKECIEVMACTCLFLVTHFNYIEGNRIGFQLLRDGDSSSNFGNYQTILREKVDDFSEIMDNFEWIQYFKRLNFNMFEEIRQFVNLQQQEN